MFSGDGKAAVGTRNHGTQQTGKEVCETSNQRWGNNAAYKKWENINNEQKEQAGGG